MFTVTSDQISSGGSHARPVDSKIHVKCNPAQTQLAKSKKVLLLQGPVGPFYDRLTRWLHAGGAEVHRVVFHGGDVHDCQLLKPIAYRGTPGGWPAFLTRLIQQLDIDCVVMFGQCRRYHVKAREIAQIRNLPVVVLEEGYFRPGFITMELGGVNGYSTTLQRHAWQRQPVALVKEEAGSIFVPPGDIQPDASPRHFQKMAWHASQHYMAMHNSREDFPHYVHHRPDNPYDYATYWLRSWTRKLLRKTGDYRLQGRLFEGTQPYYFVPLQHDGDAQITHHSPFPENADFIIRVMRSFGSHAPKNALLVFRQHPHSRGGPGHKRLISILAAELRLDNRVQYLVEGDTPDLAQRAQGVVLINSTVGLQALERGAPLMALGEALYKQPHLTFTGDLDAFWYRPQPADATATAAFLAQVKNLTQAPASVYALRDEPLQWART